MQGEQDGHARLFHTAEAVLDMLDVRAQGLGHDVAVMLGRIAVAGENGRVHAAGEVFAGGRDHDHPGAGIVVDVVDDFRQFVPERLVHCVQRLGPVHPDVGDLVFDGDFKALVSHAFLLSLEEL